MAIVTREVDYEIPEERGGNKGKLIVQYYSGTDSLEIISSNGNHMIVDVVEFAMIFDLVNECLQTKGHPKIK